MSQHKLTKVLMQNCALIHLLILTVIVIILQDKLRSRAFILFNITAMLLQY